MAAQDGLTFEGTFNNSSTGLFKTNTSQAIGSDDQRALVTAIKESYLNRIDDVLDEDDMASNSAAAVPTQQSVKAYVDAAALGIVTSWKAPVKVSTTANGTLATDFENGDTIDGVVLATGDRILIKNQSTQSENGIYVVAASGAPARSSDANVAAELEGAAVTVQQGTSNANTTWVQTTDGITLGSSNIVFVQFGGGSFVPLTLTGDTAIDGQGNELILQGGAGEEAKYAVDGPNNTQHGYIFKTGGVVRWQIHTDNNETGVSNVGSDFHIERFDDAGNYLDTPLNIDRTDGVVDINLPPQLTTAPSAAANNTQVPTTAWVQTELAEYVNEETFATLTFASPTVWACNSRQMPLAKVTATGDFTIDMTNVKSGSQGILKVTASTASAFTITFDTDFTNVEATTNASLLTYTFPADNGQFYLLNFVCDGTILHWTVLDVQTENPIPFAQISRAASQSINNNDSTVFVTMDTETHDNSSIWAVSPNPTRFTIPGSGDKVATISIRAQWAANATGVRRNIPYLNGSTTGDIAQTTGISGVACILNSTHQVACTGGDYIEILCYQNSGGALSLDVCGVRIQIHDR